MLNADAGFHTEAHGPAASCAPRRARGTRMNAIRSRFPRVSASACGPRVSSALRDGRACAAPQPLPYQSEGQERRRGELREQPLPRLGAAVEGLERPAERVRHLVARRQARARAIRCCCNERSQRIARNLGLGGAGARPRSASTATRTTCPWRSAASASSSTTACRCEACHGPAGRWIASHVEHGRHARAERRGTACTRPATGGARDACACRATSATPTASSRTA